MIRTFEVGPSTSPTALRKEFRKLLMTGGGIVRLAAGLSEQDLRTIFDSFSPDAVGHNLSAMVLEQVAAQAKDPNILALLRDCGLARVHGALWQRFDLPADFRSHLPSAAQDGALAIAHLAGELADYSAHELRLFFQQHLGEADVAVEARLALCRVQAPRDILWLLSRDANREVRYAARNRMNQVGEKPSGV